MENYPLVQHVRNLAELVNVQVQMTNLQKGKKEGWSPPISRYSSVDRLPAMLHLSNQGLINSREDLPMQDLAKLLLLCMM